MPESSPHASPQSGSGPSSRPRAVVVPPDGLPGAPGEAALHARLLADPRIDRVLVPASALRTRVAALAAAIVADCAALPELTLVVVLKGAVTFAADLSRALCVAGAPPLRTEFVRASTYGLGIKGAGETERAVRIELAPAGMEGRDALLVEDLVDQAFTLTHLQGYLRDTLRVRSLRTIVLAEKRLEQPAPSVQRLRESLRPDYVGFQLPDRWVAGYGIDAGEHYRDLPCIVTVHEEHFRT